jgi:hypothetical protein
MLRDKELGAEILCDDFSTDTRCMICASTLHTSAQHDEAWRATARDIAARYSHHWVSPLRKRAEKHNEE